MGKTEVLPSFTQTTFYPGEKLGQNSGANPAVPGSGSESPMLLCLKTCK